jgi:hypothetical protein
MSLQIRLAQDNPGAWPVRESDHGMPVAVVPSNLGAVPVRISSNIGSVPVRVMSGELSPDTPVDPVVPVPDILWWKFTEGSGTSIGATVGPNGTTDASWVTGKNGSGFALDFNGANSASTSTTVTYGTNTITICGWFWFTASGSVFLLESGPGFPPPNSVGIYQTVGELYVSNSGTTGELSEKVAFSTTGEWVHIAVVVSPTEAKLFINAVEQSTTNTSNNRTGTSNFADQTLYVGALSTGAYMFNGRIDDLRIYSGDQSAELAAIMADSQ